MADRTSTVEGVAAARPAPSQARSSMRALRRDSIQGWLFLAPFLIVFLVFLIYPLGRGVWISLHDWELVGDYRQYIGFANYRDLWDDKLFWTTLRNTLT